MLVTSDMELSVMKNKIAEIKAQLNLSRRERTSSQPDRDGSFVSGGMEGGGVREGAALFIVAHNFALMFIVSVYNWKHT